MAFLSLTKEHKYYRFQEGRASKKNSTVTKILVTIIVLYEINKK